MDASRVLRLMALREARRTLTTEPCLSGARKLATIRRAIQALWLLSTTCKSQFAIHNVGMAERVLFIQLEKEEA